jgi:hypothetical protein
MTQLIPPLVAVALLLLWPKPPAEPAVAIPPAPMMPAEELATVTPAIPWVWSEPEADPPPAQEADAVQPQPVYVVVEPPPPQVDPWGFGPVLNMHRAQNGLRPLAYDPSIDYWCYLNNAQQRIRGIGHFVLGTGYLGQNAHQIAASASKIALDFMNSPGHRKTMLNRTATRYGFRLDGVYSTMEIH